MQQYVLGFCFSEDEEHVLLIHKNRPEWQKGRLNGVGGKIENEPAIDAMRREFFEETGVYIENWNYLGDMRDNDWQVFVYYTYSNDIYETKTITDEQLKIITVAELNNFPVISNLKWLIPMCLDDISYKFELF